METAYQQLKAKDKQLDEFFLSKNIKISFNTIGANDQLVRSYVGNFNKITRQYTKSRSSNHYKHLIYHSMYDHIPWRMKKTGFEHLKTQDLAFRKLYRSRSTVNPFKPIERIYDKENDDGIHIDYLDLFKKHLKTIDNPLLYLSGGLDSEFVACAMIDAGISFSVIIFNYLDKQNRVINREETSYAIEFCKRNRIFPIVRDINVEHLWETSEFLNFCLDIEIPSPQVGTQYYLTLRTALDFPNHTHVHGGEVRFNDDYLDSDLPSNVIQLAKVNPFNGGGQMSNTGSNGGSYRCDISLTSDGYWSSSLVNYGSFTFNVELDPPTGRWYIGTPSGTYYARRVVGGLNYTGYPSDLLLTPTSSYSVLGGLTSYCGTVSTAPGRHAGCEMTNYIRTGTSGGEVAATVSMYAEYAP